MRAGPGRPSRPRPLCDGRRSPRVDRPLAPPFVVTTRIPYDPRHLTPADQRAQLAAWFSPYPGVRLTTDVRSHHHSRLHMRFAYFELAGGGQLLYLLERSLDMPDPRTGSAAVADTYVLEFAEVPPGLAAVLGL